MFYETNIGKLHSDGFLIRNHHLLFASLHGREADVMQLLAQLTDANRHSQQLDYYEGMQFRTDSERHQALYFENLTKETTKYFHPEYGMMTHLFLFNKALKEVDRDKKQAWLVLADENTDEIKALHAMLKNLSDIPIMDKWLAPLTAQLMESGHIQRFAQQSDFERLTDGVHGVRAYNIKIPDDFDEMVQTNLQFGRLTVH